MTVVTKTIRREARWRKDAANDAVCHRGSPSQHAATRLQRLSLHLVPTVSVSLSVPAAALASPLVLVAEDHDDSRLIVTTILRHAGLRVVEAVDGDEALATAQSAQPAVLVLDVGMPKRDGFAVAAELKRDPATRAIRIVMVTAHALPEDRARAASSGVDLFLTKPVGPAALLQAVRDALRDASGPPP